MQRSSAAIVSTSLAVSITISLSALVSQSAFANDYSPLFKAKKYDEVARVANAKLSVEPNNADALIAKAKLILIEGKESRLDEAAKLAEQCINANPSNSDCQESLGEVLGTKAMRGGIMSAIGYASKIRDAFQKAVELNPQNIEARSSLMEYYMQAPSIAGGGKGKAEKLITETVKINPAAGTLMQAKLDIADENFSKAEAAILSVNATNSEQLSDMQADLLQSLGSNYAKQKKYADASRVFQESQRRFPDKQGGFYGMARNLQEQGKHKEAITFFEKALAIDAQSYTYYRMGQCLQALSDKAKAIVTFEKALSFKPELPKKIKDDVEAQLKMLRG
ncbi:tetratricopeptide (TPR) repeat protein [Undibacterium sp. GrIS 1.8]|uniref:tetratricopeptide repeat protein n=1 Tax=unclassified Undibacterium TaxID=2630295 RepID=UPI003394620C